MLSMCFVHAANIYGCGATHQVEIKLPEEKGFKVIKIRWIVERTFAWLTRNRRLVREYERNTSSSEAMVYIASSRLILKHFSS